MSDPTVSVIVPCYRQAHFLPTAVDSVLAQTYPAVEPIVVNDGSDDETAEVAARYGERIRYVWKENGGLSSARNAGIAAATGEYLLCLDSDDALHPDAIARLVEGMQGRENRFLVMGFQVFDESPKRPRSEHPLEHFETALPLLIHANIAPPQCFLCPRSAVLEAGGFEETLRSCEDWDLWLRLALAGHELKRVPFTGAYYRRYAGSMSTNQERMLRTRTEVLLRAHGAIVDSADLLHRYGPDLLESEHRILRRLAFQQGDRHVSNALAAALEELLVRGVCRERSRPRAAMERLFGYWVTESAMRRVLPWLRPSAVRLYSRGFQ